MPEPLRPIEIIRPKNIVLGSGAVTAAAARLDVVVGCGSGSAKVAVCTIF